MGCEGLKWDIKSPAGSLFAPDTAQAGSEAVEGISKEKLNLNKTTISGYFALVYFGRCSFSSTLLLGSCFFFPAMLSASRSLCLWWDTAGTSGRTSSLQQQTESRVE